MSELEHALRAALADPPVESPTGVREPLWDIEERIHQRRRKQRRRTVAALACAAVAAIVVPLSVYGSPGSPVSNTDSKAASGAANGNGGGGVAAVPAVVRKAAENLAKAPGSHADRTVEWVRTTVGRFEAMQGDTNNVPRNRQIYVVQIRGNFVCHACSYLGSRPPTGRAEQVTLAVNPHVSYDNFGLTQKPYDLSKLGAVHTFTLR